MAYAWSRTKNEVTPFVGWSANITPASAYCGEQQLSSIVMGNNQGMMITSWVGQIKRGFTVRLDVGKTTGQKCLSSQGLMQHISIDGGTYKFDSYV
jgi:hypothetical protein